MTAFCPQPFCYQGPSGIILIPVACLKSSLESYTILCPTHCEGPVGRSRNEKWKTLKMDGKFLNQPVSEAWWQPKVLWLVEQQAEGCLSMMRRVSQPVCIVVQENLELFQVLQQLPIPAPTKETTRICQTPVWSKKGEERLLTVLLFTTLCTSVDLPYPTKCHQ